MASITWRSREQARKQATGDAERRRAVEVNEINFPSFVSGAGAGWAEPVAPSASAGKWSEIPSTSEKSTAGVSEYKTSKPTYAPPVIISRAKIAEAIRRDTRYNRDRDYEDNESSAAKPFDDGGGWTEITKKTTVKQKTPEARFEARDYYDEDQDYFEEGTETGGARNW